MVLLVYSNYLVMFLLPISGGLGFLCPVLGVVFVHLLKKTQGEGKRTQCLISHVVGQGKKSAVTFVFILSIYVLLLSLDAIKSDFYNQADQSQMALYLMTAIIMFDWYITLTINLIRFKKELGFEKVPIVYNYNQWKKLKSIVFEKNTLNISKNYKYR